MSFNYGKEKKIFDEKWKKIREEYVTAGMSEEAITEMYEFDMDWFRSRRRYSSHTQPLPSEVIDNEDAIYSKSSLKAKYIDSFSNEQNLKLISKNSWIEEIESEALVKKIKSLSEDDLNLITALTFEGHSQRSYSALKQCSQAAISKKVKRIKIFLK